MNLHWADRKTDRKTDRQKDGKTVRQKRDRQTDTSRNVEARPIWAWQHVAIYQNGFLLKNDYQHF